MQHLSTEELGALLDQVARRTPAPGGGTAAGVHAAFAGSLLSMVAAYSNGPKFAGAEATIMEVARQAAELTGQALVAAEEDARTFAAVGAVYSLPASDDAAKAERKAAIRAALAEASNAPRDLIGICSALTSLAEKLLPVGNRSVIADVAAAAASARAAASIARVNLAANLPSMPAGGGRAELQAAADGVEDLLRRLDAVTDAARNAVAA
ncbi:cyclodeaminase/cyclohydrolase family protein [Arthrobacter sp. GCM10027362]|uniref:cyclodeaminase/cyclohydrolase family protein n=1 Tax=Arthrobacter sp. GCM10027362 TaxID=3273379 RepID=UPI00363F31EB